MSSDLKLTVVDLHVCYTRTLCSGVKMLLEACVEGCSVLVLELSSRPHSLLNFNMYHSLITRKPTGPADVTIQRSLLSQNEITNTSILPIFFQFPSYLLNF
jgi:hypothetical protein